MTFYWQMLITLGLACWVLAPRLPLEQAKLESAAYTWCIRVPLRTAFTVFFILAVWCES